MAQENGDVNSNPRLFTFIGGEVGEWRITQMRAVTGEPLADAARLSVIDETPLTKVVGTRWLLSGVTSNARYTSREEKAALDLRQAPLGRNQATVAALIPIRKNPAWWALSQEERRQIFEESSHHIQVGMQYLPGIARRLHHCRDLTVEQPFDFLTWFDYAPFQSDAFEELVGKLRSTEEWKYVDREFDVRCVRDTTKR